MRFVYKTQNAIRYFLTQPHDAHGAADAVAKRVSVVLGISFAKSEKPLA